MSTAYLKEYNENIAIPLCTILYNIANIGNYGKTRVVVLLLHYLQGITFWTFSAHIAYREIGDIREQWADNRRTIKCYSNFYNILVVLVDKIIYEICANFSF